MTWIVARYRKITLGTRFAFKISSQKGDSIKKKIYVLRKDRRHQVSEMGWSLDGDDLIEGHF